VKDKHERRIQKEGEKGAVISLALISGPSKAPANSWMITIYPDEGARLSPKRQTHKGWEDGTTLTSAK